METIRSISRALQIIHVMNMQAVWTLHELHQATALPKSTLSRILATLSDEGYIQHEDRVGTYRITRKVVELSDGYTNGMRIIDVSRPILLRVTQQIKWPLALGLLDWDAIVVRFSSMPYSPLAVTTTTLGHRLSLVDSAMGRCYLAFCSSVERTSIFDFALNFSSAHSDLLAHVTRDIHSVRQAGYAVRQPWAVQGNATLSVPVLHDNTAIAVLGMTTFGQAMNHGTIGKHLPIMTLAAKEIVEALS